MLTLDQTLAKYGALAAESIRNDVSDLSATGKTAQSVHFIIVSKGEKIRLQIRGRQFFKALETGRGPRKGTEYQGFDMNILEYMKARGIGADLSEKKRAALAKYIALKINREGDSIYQKGGRQVYSQNLLKVVDELKLAIRKDFSNFVLSEIKRTFNAG